MLTEERRQHILQLLEQHKIVKSQELMSLVNASESTIRRDLQDLEDEGLLVRVHGGAKKVQKLSQEPNMKEKTVKNTHKKQLIAKMAAAEICDDDVIYLDAGTTTQEMIPFLKGRKVTVVTNSVGHAAKLVEAAVPTMILGGVIKLTTDAVLGATALQHLQQLRFNKAFMGMNGIDADFGFSTPDPEEAAIKRGAMLAAGEVFVLADQSKFNKITFTKVLDLAAATILTDAVSAQLLPSFTEKTLIKEVPQ